MADSPSASVSPSPSPSPSPAFTPTNTNIVAIQQSDNLVITEPEAVELTIVD